MGYDDYSKPALVEEIREPCQHYFSTHKEIIREYSTDLCTKVIEHGRNGLFIEGFSGRYNVCMDEICKWLSNPDEYSDFCSAVKISVSAAIHYWNEELNHAINNTDWQAVTAIRGMLSEIMRSTPKALRENLFNQLSSNSAEDVAKHNENIKQAELMNAMLGGNIITS
jgi:hypothetical protein